MASTPKILGQVAPSAAVETDLYIVPGATKAVTSTLVFTNRGTVANTVRVAVRPAADGSTLGKHYIYYDLPIPPNDTFAATIGLTLGAADRLTVYAGLANMTFSAYGVEQT